MIRDRAVNKMGNKGIVVFALAVQLFIYAGNIGFAEESEGLSGKYKGYNVILIILDALRPDHLSCYGYNKETSPNIDKLAKDGVLFKNAFSQASYTLPSVTSIFTSVYPYSHGVMHVFKDKVPDKIDTLAQILNMYGYTSVWFGLMSDPHTGSASGLLKGFSEQHNLFPINVTGDKKLKDNEKIFKWVRNNKNERFFMTLYSYSVHEQFLPLIRPDNEFFRSIPKDFLDYISHQEKRRWDYLQAMFREQPENVITALGTDWVDTYLTQPYSSGVFDPFFSSPKTSKQKLFMEKIFEGADISYYKSFNKEQLASFINLFDSSINWVDSEMIGGLTNELKELNIYDKTIIIITADHGNIFMEHGKFGHGPWLYDEVMRVPLILHLPNLQKPAVINKLAQGIDILPTTLDLLGIEISHQAQGINLVGLIEGRKKALRNKYVFSEGIPVGTMAIRSKEWKFFHKTAEDGSLDEKLFNLKNDPQELRDVYKENPKIARQLKDRLEKWKKNLVVYQEGVSEFTPGVDERTKERIKNTGYW